MTNIQKYNSIESLFGTNYMIYLVWDIDNRCWYRPRHHQGKLGCGIFTIEERAIRYAKNINHRIVDICFKDKIPDDLIRVQQLDLGRELIIIKLRQLIEIFVFRDKGLKQSLVAQESISNG